MKEEFVTYEIAVKLKEKGFYCNEPFAMYNELGVFHKLYSSADFTVSYGVNLRDCYDYDDFDDHDTVAPTISQVLLWLREEKKIYVVVTPYPSMSTKDKVVWCYQIKHNSDGAFMDEIDGLESYMDYRWAAMRGIEYVLDNLI